jgi:hypothetical protein
MYKRTLLLSLCLAASACATPQTEAAEKQVCTTEPVEATGSRVETNTECRPAE